MKKKNLMVAVIISCFLSISVTVQAQSFGDLLKGVITEKVEEVVSEHIDFSIVGNWSYQGVAVKLNSDDALAIMGASVAETTLEQEINSQLVSMNIDPKNLTANFYSDGTFDSSIKDRRFTGTFTYDSELSELNLVFLRTIPIKANVEVLASSFSVLFNSDELLNLLKSLTDGSSNSTIATVSAILEAYDGMQIGIKFKR